MEIRRPQSNAGEIAPHDEPDTPQGSELKSAGFADSDSIASGHNNASIVSIFNTVEAPALPETPHPTIQGPHFDLGIPAADMEFSRTDTPEAREIIAIAHEAFDPKDVEAALAQIVENLKDRIQDSVESAIHPFEDWFD